MPATLPDIEYTLEPMHGRPVPTGAEIVPILRKVFDQQKDEILDWFDRRWPKKTMKDLLPGWGDDFPSLRHWNDPLAEFTYPVVELWTDFGGREAEIRLGEFPSPWDVRVPNVKESVNDASFSLSATANQTTHAKLNAIIPALRQEFIDGISLGETRRQITKRIEGVFEEAKGYRAERIARTESSRAVHMGQLLAAEQSTVVVGKQWLLSGDACPICQAIAAYTESQVVGLREPFATIGNNQHYADIQTPPAHPNCACSWIEVLSNAAPAPGPSPAVTPVKPPPKPKPEKPKPKPKPDPFAPQPRIVPSGPKPDSIAARIAANEDAIALQKKMEQVDKKFAKATAQREKEKQDIENLTKRNIKESSRLNNDLIFNGKSLSPSERAKIKKRLKELKAERKEIRKRRTSLLKSDLPGVKDARRAIGLPSKERAGLTVTADYSPAMTTDTGGTKRTTMGRSFTFEKKRKKAQAFTRSVFGKTKDTKAARITVKRMPPEVRAFSRHGDAIYLTAEDGTPTFIHEIAHQIEDSNPEIKKAVNDFLDYRIAKAGTKNVKLKDVLQGSYWDNEVGNEDGFRKAFGEHRAYYVGKRYVQGSTEVLSMGLEELYNNPVALAKNDPEFFRFIVGIIRGTY